MMMTYLKTFEPLVQLLFEAIHLSDEHAYELINPPHQRVENDAVDSIIDFYQRAERLIICGDYDCDGIASTSIAVMLAKKCGIEVGYYIPNRFTEGYGVSIPTIDRAHSKGYTDVLIIDNGVKSHDVVEHAKNLGMRVAIVDHHIIEAPIEVDSFLHPDVCDEYADSMCASGLIYCVAETMGLHDDYLLALACLGTIADVMPLWGKNREIVREGIEAIKRNSFLQFDVIVKPNKYTSYSAKTLAFKMIPKINSIGRMADVVNVNTAVSYFTTQDTKAIRSYASQVEKLNSFRKDKGKEMQVIAEKKITDDSIQIITDTDFHEGLVGIVANKISDTTQKPTIILREYENTYKGSARSNTHSLQNIFSQVDRKYFEAMGGHDFAFGMTIKKEYYQDFISDINKVVDALDHVSKTDNVLKVPSDLITKNALQELASFEPYGEGFTLPLVEVLLPQGYNMVDLRGYGYKLVFQDFPIDEAVFFNTVYSRNDYRNFTKMIGRFDISNTSKISFNIESMQ
ncbi:DHH family phosphoesterase [Erysipelothrix sp. HDW6A]|uniref:single-stranded-DNA-specific exonuclease RecJ n=1 Tax=Erysipelothrix sp. HDW6A TaxID=2714928 RepID=UPI001F101BF4|nr:DHH family phosphoesterase [Erysipelothrix sp. HDW6A]